MRTSAVQWEEDRPLGSYGQTGRFLSVPLFLSTSVDPYYCYVYKILAYECVQWNNNPTLHFVMKGKGDSVHTVPFTVLTQYIFS